MKVEVFAQIHNLLYWLRNKISVTERIIAAGILVS